jgi:hypothetical protein
LSVCIGNLHIPKHFIIHIMLLHKRLWIYKYIFLIFNFLHFTNSDSQKFQCPNNKNALYEDEVQCDKYYECHDGIAKERLCPDGLVFDATIRRLNKCDQPFNVDCGDRTELRK